jgi:bifunctional DNA-binding transcriptional regulator/antitoxin component of YhaV-PrlF toxin-antitoxin module
MEQLNTYVDSSGQIHILIPAEITKALHLNPSSPVTVQIERSEVEVSNFEINVTSQPNSKVRVILIDGPKSAEFEEFLTEKRREAWLEAAEINCMVNPRAVELANIVAECEKTSIGSVGKKKQMSKAEIDALADEIHAMVPERRIPGSSAVEQLFKDRREEAELERKHDRERYGENHI